MLLFLSCEIPVTYHRVRRVCIVKSDLWRRALKGSGRFWHIAGGCFSKAPPFYNYPARRMRR